ncbi:MAG: crotonobetainyl-CoA:carnitine CoA-transferase CaiB-like acyl-CoA transferase [Gammaproteobacteria bacterium]|jgi:crotonobetainyl-CoA:carnitine CoA-transferase CaiB-like acyl-CoA transferase
MISAKNTPSTAPSSTQVPATELPLAGVVVVELGSSIAGPYAARILSDMGAQVFKVEHPVGGDSSRAWGARTLNGTTAVYQCMNRGKRSITVDMKNAEDVAQLKRFVVQEVDVVVQNLRPGSAAGFGLGADELLALKPSLIYCDQGTFGHAGPLAHLPGYDPLMQGFSGIADITGEGASGPSRVGPPLVDLGTGMWSAMGILAALHQRNTSGCGGKVQTSLYETALAYMTVHASLYQTTGVAPKRDGLRGPMIAPNGGYECADGVLMIVCATEAQTKRLCDTIEAPHLLDNPNFATTSSRSQHHDAFAEALNVVLRHHPRAHWAAKLDAANIPNAPVHSLPEMMVHEQTLATGMLQQAPDGTFTVVALPIQFDGARRAFDAFAPELGDSDDVLREGSS